MAPYILPRVRFTLCLVGGNINNVECQSFMLTGVVESKGRTSLYLENGVWSPSTRQRRRSTKRKVSAEMCA